jgi:hypothetical protein
MNRSTSAAILNVQDLTVNDTNDLSINDFNIRIYHSEDDPENTNRVRISAGATEVEMLPSKGLSLGQAWINGKPVFWEVPINLPDTETIDLWSDEVCINGVPAKGFTFLKTLVAGIELYGLENWGMPVEKDGKLKILHGETSNIPVSEIQYSVEKDICTIQSGFDYRTFEGDTTLPWYLRGEALFRVTKRLVLKKDSPEIKLVDIIENISTRSLIPDWGYHITFRPEEGARYLVPSQSVSARGGYELPADIETWHKAADEIVRTETGIIHKDLLQKKSANGNKLSTTLLVYPGSTGIAVTTTHAPYFQTWFCCGGKDSTEFTFRNGESLLKRNWDGMGIEIGSSPLDHDGNIDTKVKCKSILNPGDRINIEILITRIEDIQLKSLKEEIERYNINRKGR